MLWKKYFLLLKFLKPTKHSKFLMLLWDNMSYGACEKQSLVMFGMFMSLLHIADSKNNNQSILINCEQKLSLDNMWKHNNTSCYFVIFEKDIVFQILFNWESQHKILQLYNCGEKLFLSKLKNCHEKHFSINYIIVLRE